MTMEPSAEMPKQSGLIDLKPVEWSKPWFLQQGKASEAAEIDRQSEIAKKRLKDPNISLTSDEIQDFIDLSVNAGDPVFYRDAVSKAELNDIPWGGELYRESSKQAVFRNAAVLFRDEATRAQKEGRVRVVEVLSQSSGDYYEKYKLAYDEMKKVLQSEVLK